MIGRKSSQTLQDKKQTKNLRSRRRERKLLLEQLEDRRMLASLLYVDNSDYGSAGDGNGQFTTTGQDPVLNLTLGQNLFTSISAAVAAANDNYTIRVADGAYTEDISVNKPLTIQGANAGISAGSTPGSRGAETVLTGGFRVTVSPLTIDGFTILSGVGR